MSKKGTGKRKHLTTRLVAEQNHRCCYCGCRLETSRSKRNKGNYATLEHVFPKENFKVGIMHHNGKEIPQYDPSHMAWENCVAACSSCNHKRGTIDAYLFAEHELWRPENANLLKLQRLGIAFKIHGSIKTLTKMTKLCGPSCY